MSESLQTDIKGLNDVKPINKTKTVVIQRRPETHQVYRIPLRYLYYNRENDRISTEVVRYSTEHGSSFPEDREEFNKVFEELIVNSKKDAIQRTQKSIANRGQDNPGVVLKDGRVIDGNRRFTCLRRIQAETNQEQFFEAIILDYDYEADYKTIKALELELQMGVEDKVKYDPIDRLFGVYKAIRIEKAFTVEEYAALFDHYPVKKVKEDLELADLMCEYLEFQGTPGMYFIAKDMDLEGTLHEIPSILHKVKEKDPDLVDDVKTRIFSCIATGVTTKLNDLMRAIKVVVDEGSLQKFLDDTEHAVKETEEAIQAKPIKTYMDLAEGVRSRDDIKDELSEAVSSQKKVIDSRKLKKAPIKNSKEALISLQAITPDSIAEMDDDDRRELESIWEKIEDSISGLRSRIEL